VLRRKLVKRLLLVALVLCAGAVLWSPIQDAIHRHQLESVLNEPLSGHVAVLHVRSKALRRVNAIYVYTPPGYERSEQRYPVVYLLHGCPGQGMDWFIKAHAHETADKLILSKQIQPVILVSFDGFGPGGPRDHSEFLNSVHGTVMVEDYVADELPRFIDSVYRTIPSPDARALVGLSSGGYGAVNLGTKHQDTYRVLASHSGYFDPVLERRYIERMLGPEGPLWDQNNPHEQVGKWRTDPDLHIYMDCGSSDELFDDNKRLDKELADNGIKHVFHATQGGHYWGRWAMRLGASLRYCDSRFEELRAPGNR
jgi:putative tributyrin esterase